MNDRALTHFPRDSNFSQCFYKGNADERYGKVKVCSSTGTSFKCISSSSEIAAISNCDVILVCAFHLMKVIVNLRRVSTVCLGASADQKINILLS